MGAASIPSDEHTFTVSGKEVTVISRIPLRDAPELSALLAQVPNLDARVLVKFCTQAIASWDFDGDPKNRKSYDDLDVIEELIPIANGVAAKMVARMDRATASPKG